MVPAVAFLDDAHPQLRAKGHTRSRSITLPVYSVSILLHPVKDPADHLYHHHHHHTRTHTTHAQNTRIQNYQDFNYFTTLTQTAQPLLSTQGDTGMGFSYHQQRWSRRSFVKLESIILWHHSIPRYYPFYYSAEGTLFLRSFLNVLCAF